MELSILAAKIAALIYISAGLGAMLGQMDYKKVYDSFETSPGLVYLTGFVSLLVGMIMVNHHNIWAANWTVLITFMGWAALIKGVLLIAFPKSIVPFKSWFQNARIFGAFALIFGFIFAYFGFVL